MKKNNESIRAFILACIFVIPTFIFLANSANAKDDKNEYSCLQNPHPPNAMATALETKGSTGQKIILFDESTQTKVGSFTFTGELLFFDGGESTEVGKGTKVRDFLFGNYHHASSKSLKICASGKYFILSSNNRRFRLYLSPSSLTALILEIN